MYKTSDVSLKQYGKSYPYWDFRNVFEKYRQERYHNFLCEHQLMAEVHIQKFWKMENDATLSLYYGTKFNTNNAVLSLVRPF